MTLTRRDAKASEKVSAPKATTVSTLSHLKRFFQWLAGQPGYRARFNYTDADYFSPSDKDARVASARRRRPVPTLDQVQHVLKTMPAANEIERRNQALIAFILLTGARDRAVASAKLRHVDLNKGVFDQDAREVATKFSKTFPTFFFRVGDEVLAIVRDWVTYLRTEKLWGDDDPLFPKTQVSLDEAGRFEHTDLSREHWADASPIRSIFKEAFVGAGLPYFNPHSLRSTLVALGQRLCRSPEEFKVWSQNLGHEEVMTTLTSYGTVAVARQAEIIASLGASGTSVSLPNELADDAVLGARIRALLAGASTESAR